jgi:hydrogenase maturation protease
VPEGGAENEILVIGAGNDWRGDDGVGRFVARLLAKASLPGVRVAEAEGEATSLIALWTGMRRVFLIDASVSGAAAGTVHRFDVSTRPLPRVSVGRTSHSFGIAEAVELSRSLGSLPAQVIVFGIEGQTFETGAELSVPVRRSAEDVVQRIIEEIRSA